MTTSQTTGNATATKLLRLAVAATLALFFAVALKLTWHWPFVGDAQVIHYVVFLMHHGFAPYRQTFDMNMPGAYLFEDWALAIFGTSDLGWRIYDLFLTITLTAGMIAIARRPSLGNDWLAGFAAAVIFFLRHLSDGPLCAGQRDLVMAVLLIVSCACLFESIRQRRPWLMLPFALAAAMAASVKPTLLPVGIVILFLACLHLKRSATSVRPYCLFAIGGLVLATGIVVAFLLQTHSTVAFWHTVTQVLPHYNGLEHPPLKVMVLRSLPMPLVIFFPLAFLTAMLRRCPQSWEECILLTYGAFGIFSYFVQDKGFPQHRYTFLAFLLLWACLQIAQAMRSDSIAICVATAGILCGLLYVCPRELYRIRLYAPHEAYSDALERDLIGLGTANLQHETQCLDIIDGCLAALWHLQIVQATGATGDLTLFLPGQASTVAQARTQMGALFQQHPPTVFILSNVQFGVDPRSFDGKLATWPQFSEFLRSNYLLTQQRAFRDNHPIDTTPGQDSADIAYRIYIRRDSPLLRTAP